MSQFELSRPPVSQPPAGQPPLSRPPAGLAAAWRVGDVTIAPVIEIDAGRVIQAGVAAATPERVRAIGWLAPHYADTQGGLKAVVQAFLITAQGRRVLVDTCVGNAKSRPGLPAWDGLKTPFLRRLAALGADPGDVDAVVCTHFHFDHVGWNTTLAGGRWTPTFPGARHVFSRAELEYWQGQPAQEHEDDRAGFADSVLPVCAAGLADPVSPGYEVVPGISLLSTPGHTPGHVSVLVESAGERAIISGDALHHPGQVARPEWCELSDFDPELARRSRVALLERCADTGALLIGSHFAAPAAGRVRRAGPAFRLEP